jgi:hypothetical protein
VAQPLKIDKRALVGGLVVSAMLIVPMAVGYKAIEPVIFEPARQLFKRLPVTYANLSPIKIRHRKIKGIPVRVIQKGKGKGANIRITYKDNSPIKIIRKDSRLAERMEDLPGLPQMRVRRTFTRGLQPRTAEE